MRAERFRSKTTRITDFRKAHTISGGDRLDGGKLDWYSDGSMLANAQPVPMREQSRIY